MMGTKIYRRSDGAVFYITNERTITTRRGRKEIEFTIKKHGAEKSFKTNKITFDRIYTKSKKKIEK